MSAAEKLAALRQEFAATEAALQKTVQVEREQKIEIVRKEFRICLNKLKLAGIPELEAVNLMREFHFCQGMCKTCKYSSPLTL